MNTTPTDAYADAYATGVACFQAGQDALAARAAGEALAGPYPADHMAQVVWQGDVRDLGNRAVDGWLQAEEEAASLTGSDRW